MGVKCICTFSINKIFFENVKILVFIDYTILGWEIYRTHTMINIFMFYTKTLGFSAFMICWHRCAYNNDALHAWSMFSWRVIRLLNDNCNNWPLITHTYYVLIIGGCFFQYCTVAWLLYNDFHVITIFILHDIKPYSTKNYVCLPKLVINV